MRWLMLGALAVGCDSKDAESPVVFEVTVTNTAEDCSNLAGDMSEGWGPTDLVMADVCNCTDEDGSDCMDDIERKSESLTYNFFEDGADVSIEVDGQSFATGVFSSFEGCELKYTSPNWLDMVDGKKVVWQVRSVDVLADATGGCNLGKHDLLGIEEIEIMESESEDDYPVGRTVQKVIYGKVLEVEE